jgi:hypothetical protein
MKLVRQSARSRQYVLNKDEGFLLKNLLKQFPFTGDFTAKISRTDTRPKVVEREKMLNESLAEHRNELRKQAMNLLAAGKFEDHGQGHLLTLNGEECEILLQILNDIRVGCWRALGEPEILELLKPDHSEQELAHHSLMNLAGYFEHHLIDVK